LLTAFSVAIECTKEGVKFGCSGDIGSGSVSLRPHTNVEDEAQNIEISLSEPVALTFSLKYLVNFCKASGLSSQVKLCLSNEVPLLVEYALANNSYLRFYLAPKVRPVHFFHCSGLQANHLRLDRGRRVGLQPTRSSPMRRKCRGRFQWVEDGRVGTRAISP
jgi:hypothetical protein